MGRAIGLVMMLSMVAGAGCGKSAPAASGATTPVAREKKAPPVPPDTTGFIPIAQAIATAQEKVPGGVAVAAQLEIEDDEPEPPSFEVVLVSADRKWVEVEVDAKTGAVLEVETQGEGHDDDDGGDDDDDGGGGDD
jgi:hypothetical protein